MTIVKIDGSLVRDVDRDERRGSSWPTSRRSRPRSSSTPIVEGVETEIEAEAVAEAGFRFAQGRCYGPPVEVAEFSTDPVELVARPAKPIESMELADR